jgi:hypothetical protein
MGFMMVALRQHLPHPFNSAMEVHCANYFQMVLLRRVFSRSLAQPTFPICPNKKPATSRPSLCSDLISDKYTCRQQHRVCRFYYSFLLFEGCDSKIRF